MTTQSWKRVTKGTFLPSYIETDPVVSDKKIFKVLYIAIKPYPLTAIFFFFWRIMAAWKNLTEGHQRNILAKLNWNRFSGFWQEDFQSFLSRYIGKIGKISPTPQQLCFLTNQDCLNILDRGSPKQHWNRSGGIWQEEFQSFLYRYIWKKKPRPHWGHVFWRIMKAWTILVECNQSNIPVKLHWTRCNGFLQEDFLKFFI